MNLIKQGKKERIMVFGTFDILHKGHISFFKQARKLAKKPYLIVSVARDKNVKKIKGLSPTNNERKRLAVVRVSRFVNEAVLGGLKNHITHIIQQKPHIIALGYDQKAYVKGLGKALKAKGLPVTIKRLKAFKPRLYKSSKLLPYEQKKV